MVRYVFRKGSQQTSSVIAGLWHARPSPHFRGWAPQSRVIRQPQGEFGPLERGFIAKKSPRAFLRLTLGRFAISGLG